MTWTIIETDSGSDRNIECQYARESGRDGDGEYDSMI